jgi:hypothetical protein
MVLLSLDIVHSPCTQRWTVSKEKTPFRIHAALLFDPVLCMQLEEMLRKRRNSDERTTLRLRTGINGRMYGHKRVHFMLLM